VRSVLHKSGASGFCFSFKLSIGGFRLYHNNISAQVNDFT